MTSTERAQAPGGSARIAWFAEIGSQADRDAAEEDFEVRKDDVAARSGLLGGGAGDYERDSEPPRP